MSARKKLTNVVSLADYRRREVAPPTLPDPRILYKARLVIEFAESIGIDLRLLAAMARGDIKMG
jgi:hypothetical protein